MALIFPIFVSAQDLAGTVSSTTGITVKIFSPIVIANNEYGYPQMFALTQNFPSGVIALRGVAGCHQGFGEIGFYNRETQKAIGEPVKWVRNGDKLSDAIAEVICGYRGKN